MTTFKSYCALRRGDVIVLEDTGEEFTVVGLLLLDSDTAVIQTNKGCELINRRDSLREFTVTDFILLENPTGKVNFKKSPA